MEHEFDIDLDELVAFQRKEMAKGNERLTVEKLDALADLQIDELEYYLNNAPAAEDKIKSRKASAKNNRKPLDERYAQFRQKALLHKTQLSDSKSKEKEATSEEQMTAYQKRMKVIDFMLQLRRKEQQEQKKESPASDIENQPIENLSFEEVVQLQAQYLEEQNKAKKIHELKLQFKHNQEMTKGLNQ